MKKILIIIISFYLALICLMPKIELFYTLEHKLKDNRTIISNEIVKDRGILFSMQDATIYYDKLEFANIESFKIFPFLLFNYISIDNLAVSDNFKNQFPASFETIKMFYSPFYPFKIFIFVSGGGSGSVDLKEKLVKIEFSDDGNLDSKLTKFFKKVEDKLVYEYRY